jgi:asparagine synthase (glutamine-hydrolysing)
MCGFLGYIGDVTIDDASFGALLARSRSRGPDHAGIFRSGKCVAGFNRLSIQDLSTHGHQPMTNEAGNRILLFNGEIYNHQQIRTEFGLSECKGHGDTETIFRLFLQEDIPNIVERFDGMFAITWIDLSRNLLYLIRDRAGIKPLYYYLGNRGLVFASQLDQVLHFPDGVTHQLDGSRVYDYFSLGYMIAPNTIYRDIHQVEPGQILTIDLTTGMMIDQRYYHQLKRRRSAAHSITTDGMPEAIDLSVREQLVSDVPVAAFMSGGIDSPVINACAVKQVPDLKAFTFRNLFDDSLDESKVANELSRSIGMPFENISYDTDDVLEMVDRHFEQMPEPLGDFSTIPTFLICRSAAEKATVVLSGDGGDELFFGYTRHISFFRHGWLFRWPLALRRPMARLVMRLSGGKVSNSIRNHRYPGDAYRETQTAVSQTNLGQMLKGQHYSKACDQVFCTGPKGLQKDIVELISRADFYGFLQRVLRKVDMMSMANSVEVRVPYLCNELIHMAERYVPDIRSDEDLKKPLKKLFSKLYPGLKPFRRKIGFTLPIEKLLKGALREDVLKHTCECPVYGDYLIDTSAFRSYIKDYYAGRHGNHQGVWHLYAWQKWAVQQQLNKFSA